jgi:hypothetical protein
MGNVDGMARRKKNELSGLRTQLATMVERVNEFDHLNWPTLIV